MDRLKIRRYKVSDNPIVWELHKIGLEEIGIKPRRNRGFDRDLNDIENIYFDGGDFIVGEISGKVVAMGAFKRINAEVAEIKRMRVDPYYQRRGFGQTIMEELEKRAKKMGYKRLILDTSQKWTKAQNFYKKNGFVEIGRNDPDGRYNAIFYEKNLI